MVEVIGLNTKLNFAVDLSCGNTVSRNCLPIGILALVIDSIGFPSDSCGLATSSRQDEDLSRRDDSVGGFGNLVVHDHCDCVCLGSSLLKGAGESCGARWSPASSSCRGCRPLGYLRRIQQLKGKTRGECRY